MKKQLSRQVKYVWIYGDWTQCTATCGGGTQSRGPLCQESVVAVNSTFVDGTSVIVDELLCDPEEQPDSMMRACNDEQCPSRWWVGPWQSCPMTCSSKVFLKTIPFSGILT